MEEIENCRKKGKKVLIYFSDADIPRAHDPEQLRQLKAYRSQLEKDTLYDTFVDGADLRRRATRHLASTINALLASNVPAASIEKVPLQLSPEGRELLNEAAQDSHLSILVSSTFDGDDIQSHGRNFIERGNAKSAAIWKEALLELESQNMIRARGSARSIFGVGWTRFKSFGGRRKTWTT